MIAFPWALVINLKIVGFQYYTDSQLTTIALIASISSAFGRFLSGYFLDKSGIINVVRFVSILSFVNIIFYYFLQDHLIVYTLNISVFYGMIACVGTFNTMIVVIMYGVDLGMKMQALTAAVPAFAAVFIWFFDVYVFGKLGLEALCLLMGSFYIVVILYSHKIFRE